MGAATMAALPGTKKATLLHDAAHHELSGGFGLATVKQEGASIAYDQVGERYARALVVSMRQTKEIVAKNVLGRVFDDDHETEEGYTYRTYRVGRIIR